MGKVGLRTSKKQSCLMVGLGAYQSDALCPQLPLKPIARIIQTSVIGLGLGMATSLSQAATIMVTNNGDADVGCTLREAITSLNDASVGVNGCAVASGTFGDDDSITFANSSPIQLTQGQLNIESDKQIIIDASSVSGVTVTADANSRVFNVEGGGESTQLGIKYVTVTGGEADFSGGGGILVGEGASLNAKYSHITGNFAEGPGGGVSGKTNSKLVFLESTVTNNTSNSSGGGISNKYSNKKYGNLVLMANSTVSGNTASGDGGGISLDINKYNGGAVFLISSTISGNSAGGAGGGISADNTKAYISDNNGLLGSSNVLDNHAAGNGGGISLSSQSSIYVKNKGYDGSVTPVNSRILNVNNNTSDGRGGGIYLNESALLNTKFSSISISGNSAALAGGGLSMKKYSAAYVKYATIDSNQSDRQGGGVYAKKYSRLNIESSTISNNSSGLANDAVGYNSTGGGIAVKYNSSLSLTNSTISGNWTPDVAYGGGGVHINGSAVDIEFSTIANNRGDNGGAIRAVYSSSGSIENSILADSRGSTYECVLSAGVVIDKYSIVEDGSCGTVSGDPRIGRLANNGGSTRTHLMAENSIAIDAGGEFCPDVDQRGKVRVNSMEDLCDVGAVEFKDSDITSFFVIPLPGPGNKTVVIPL